MLPAAAQFKLLLAESCAAIYVPMTNERAACMANSSICCPAGCFLTLCRAAAAAAATYTSAKPAWQARMFKTHSS